MFGTIRKHQTWLWVIIIAVVVVSFVFWGSQTGRYSHGPPRPDFGTINGEKITLDKFQAAQREVYLDFFLRYGEWPDQEAQRTGFEADRETFYRLLLLQKLKDFNLHVSRQAALQRGRDILRYLGGGQPVSLELLVQRKLSERGLTAEDFERYVRHDLGLQELVTLVGGSGRLVTPEEARAVYAREHEELSVEVVNFLAVDHLAEVIVAPEAVAQFYTNRMAAYRLPERVQVSYVAFPLSNHLAAAEAELVKSNLNALVEANLQRLGTNYLRLAATPEEARARLREGLIRQQALTLARAQAKDFANAVFRLEPPRPENLATLAAEKGLALQVTEPFDRKEGPKGLPVGPAFLQAAFKLTADYPLAGPILGEDAVYVIALRARLPSEVPPLESIRAQVATDYRYEQAVQRARQAGTNFLATLTNGLALGKTFGELCTAAKRKPVLLPPFSLSTRALPEVEQDLPLSQFKQVAFRTPVGQVSDLTYTRDGGLILHVRSRLPLDQAKMKEELPRFTASLRQVRQNEAFSEWFRREADEGLRTTALAQMQAASRPPAVPVTK